MHRLKDLKAQNLNKRMSMKILIQTPAAILIVSGVFFLAFNDNATGWALVILGFLLSAMSLILDYVSKGGK